MLKIKHYITISIIIAYLTVNITNSQYIYELFNEDYTFKNSAFVNNSISWNKLLDNTVTKEKVNNWYISITNYPEIENQIAYWEKSFTKDILLFNENNLTFSSWSYLIATKKSTQNYLSTYLNSDTVNTFLCWKWYYLKNWKCINVEIWYYSPEWDNEKHLCTNKISNSHYINWWENNDCSWICDTWYTILNWVCMKSCWDYIHNQQWIDEIIGEKNITKETKKCNNWNIELINSEIIDKWCWKWYYLKDWNCIEVWMAYFSPEYYTDRYNCTPDKDINSKWDMTSTGWLNEDCNWTCNDWYTKYNKQCKKSCWEYIHMQTWIEYWTVQNITWWTKTPVNNLKCDDGTKITTSTTYNYSCNTGYTNNWSWCSKNTWSSGWWNTCSGIWTRSLTGRWWCSKSCGWWTQYATYSCSTKTWTETRTVNCINYKWNILSQRECLDSKPTTSQSCTGGCSNPPSSSRSCNTQSCCSSSMWSSCSIEFKTPTNESWMSSWCWYRDRSCAQNLLINNCWWGRLESFVRDHTNWSETRKASWLCVTTQYKTIQCDWKCK